MQHARIIILRHYSTCLKYFNRALDLFISLMNNSLKCVCSAWFNRQLSIYFKYPFAFVVTTRMYISIRVNFTIDFCIYQTTYINIRYDLINSTCGNLFSRGYVNIYFQLFYFHSTYDTWWIARKIGFHVVNIRWSI